MKIFFDGNEIEYPDEDGTHVLVATKGASWEKLCRARPERYETVEPEPHPTDEPVVWKHDRSKVTCHYCIAMLEGSSIQFTKVLP